VTPFGFLSVLPLKNVTLCNKGIAKMHSVREFSLLMRSPLFALPLGIPTPIQTNVGSSFGLSTVFDAVLIIGMTKSIQSFAPSAYPLPLKILVSTLGLSKIQRPHLVPICLVHSPLVSTLTISSISPKTLLSNSFSVGFWLNVAKSTLWALLNGSSKFLSLGVLLPLWLQSTSTSQVLPPIWLRASSANREILHLWLRHIGPVFLSTQLLLRWMTTILQHNYVGKRLTRVWLAARLHIPVFRNLFF
jgi:hypothetical protein